MGFAPGVALATSAGGSSISSFDPELPSCLPRSSGVSSGFIGVTTPPARRIPWYAIAQPALFGPIRATTSPLLIPSDWSSAATASTLAASSAYVVVSPEAVSTIAGSSPRAAAGPITYSGMVRSGISMSGSGLR